MSTEKFFVIQRADGDFMAIDNHSGGYSYWTKHFMQAERFPNNEKTVSQLHAIKGEGQLTVYEIMMGPGMTVAQFEAQAGDEIRKAALAKLSETERRALGLS